VILFFLRTPRRKAMAGGEASGGEY